MFGIYIEGMLRTHPADKHFIIAHSHGGNVVLQALLRSETVRDRIDGFIALGTPFLWFDKLESGWVWTAITWLSQFASTLGLLCVSVFTPILVVIKFDPPILIIVAVLIASAIVAVQLGRRWFPATKRLRDEALTVHAVPTGTRLPPLLVIRSPGDEASVVLRASMFYGGLLVIAWNIIGALFRFRPPLTRTVCHIALLATCAMLFGTLAPDGIRGFLELPAAAPLNWGDFDGLANDLGAGLKGFYMLGCFTGGFVATIAALPLALAIGPELLRISLLVQPTVEDCPANTEATVMNIQNMAGSRHSVHSHPEAVIIIERWIRSRSS